MVDSVLSDLSDADGSLDGERDIEMSSDPVMCGR